MDETRIGVYVCWCGTNISLIVDVETIAKELEQIPDVVVSKSYKYMCSDPGQDMILKDIKEHKLNRVIVAACSPRIHELTFRKVLEKADLNPYFFEMVNIREQVSWVHTDREEATKKAKALINAAIRRIVHHEAIDKRFVDINPATLIIGAGISGISAALDIADAGRKVYLIERENRIGGLVSQLDLTYPYMTSVKQTLDPLMKKLMYHPEIELFLESEIKGIFGYIGNFETTVYRKNGEEVNLKFGNVIVATGLRSFNPQIIEEYGYGELPNVLTSLDFEKLLKNGEIKTQTGKIPKHIAVIHCVGSRNQKYHEYCSTTCCMTALKYVNQIRAELPESKIYDIYADIRAIGKGCEELYTKTSRKNVKFLMFNQENGLPKIKKSNNHGSNGFDMLIEMDEIMCGKEIAVPADLVILMTALEAHESAKEIAHGVGISMCGNNFYIEKHPKLDPVATTTDGVFIVGNCHGPKNIPDSIAQGKAAAARILRDISHGSVEVEPITAEVNENLCCGCMTCINVCPYTAIEFDDEKKVSRVNEVLCKGCGTCGSTCPAGAMTCKHFTDKQILAQIEGLMFAG